MTFLHNSFWGVLVRLAIASVLLVVVNLIWLFPVLNGIRESTLAHQLQIADRIGSSIGSEMNIALRDLSNVAEDISDDAERTEFVLERFARRNEKLNGVIVLNRRGGIVERVGDIQFSEEIVAHDFASEPFFYLALEGAPNFSNIVQSKMLGSYLFIAVPIRKSGEVDGVLLAVAKLRYFREAVDAVQIKNMSVYVVDRTGSLVIRSGGRDTSNEGEYLGDLPIVQKVVVVGGVADGRTEDDTYINSFGKRVLAVGVPISPSDWGIFVEQPYASAVANERQIFAIALLAIFIIVVAYAWVLLNNMRLVRVNSMLGDRNKESYESSKILVRRDMELTQSNIKLEELINELNRVGKMLIRRDLELSRANLRLTKLDQVKSEFVSIAAHQLRTPITGIKWTLFALIDGEFGEIHEEQKNAIVKALDATERLIELIGALLNVARLEEGRFGFRFRVSSLVPLVESALKKYEPIAHEHAILISLEIGNVAIPPLLIDEEKMLIVFENLIDNSVKYTPSGGRIWVHVDVEPPDVVISVRDTGIGIPKEQFDRIFSKFFRSSNAQLFQTNGTGLGLYLLKNIVEQHGGTVKFESNEGQGSIFYVRLPCIRDRNTIMTAALERRRIHEDAG